MKIRIPVLFLAFGLPFQVPATPLDSPGVVVQPLRHPGSPPAGPLRILPPLERVPSEATANPEPVPEGDDRLPVLCACLIQDEFESEVLEELGRVVA